MIWPADASAWLVNATGATGEAEGVAILAGLLGWYGAALGACLGVVGVVLKLMGRKAS